MGHLVANSSISVSGYTLNHLKKMCLLEKGLGTGVVGPDSYKGHFRQKPSSNTSMYDSKDNVTELFVLLYLFFEMVYYCLHIILHDLPDMLRDI